MAPEPVVSVIMPVFNGEEYIPQAIGSVLEQSFRELELIVISEMGTNQASIAAVDRFDDPRIVHVKNKERLGLIESLNLGLRLTRGRYIARMDSDDISLPTRLEKQVSFMEGHPEVGVLGTHVRYIDASGRRTSRPRYFSGVDAVAWDMLFTSPLAHPSVMMRREVPERLGGYDPKAYLVEDYDLWIRTSHITQLMNLDDELVLLRKHGKNITVTRREEQNRAATRVARPEIETVLGHQVDEADVHRLRYPYTLTDGASAVAAASLLEELYSRFIEQRKPSTEERRVIEKEAERQFSVLVSLSMASGWRVTGQLLDRARNAGLGRSAVYANALARRVTGRGR